MTHRLDVVHAPLVTPTIYYSYPVFHSPGLSAPPHHCGGSGRAYTLAKAKITISSDGRFILPAELRRQDRIEPGQEFDIERIGYGKYRRIRRNLHANQGLIDWLMACPGKGYFVPIKSESTDTL